MSGREVAGAVHAAPLGLGAGWHEAGPAQLPRRSEARENALLSC